MDLYNEKSGVEVTASFTDSTNEGTIPPTVHWNLVCKTTLKTLQEDTEVFPVAVVDESGVLTCTVEIEIPGSLNAIQRNANKRELKELLVIANKDLSGEFSQGYEYYVVNKQGRS